MFIQTKLIQFDDYGINLPKLDSDLFDEFADALFTKRRELGKNQNECGVNEAVINRIESGAKKNASAKTISKIVRALGMDKSWTTKFIEYEREKAILRRQQRQEALLNFAENDELAKASPKKLLLHLAEQYSGEEFEDTFSAYQELRNVLERVKNMDAAPDLGGNLGIGNLRQEVSALNREGETDKAKTAIDLAQQQLRAEAERNVQAQIAAYELGFEQAEINNDPEMGADMIVKRLTLEARPEGLFNAIVSETNVLGRRFSGQTSRFFDKVAVLLAHGNLKRAKGENKGWAEYNLSSYLSGLAFQKQAGKEITEAITHAKQAIKWGKKHKVKRLEALSLNQYANCLHIMYERDGRKESPEIEKAARRAYRMLENGAGFDIVDRADIQSGFGSVMSELGRVRGHGPLLDEAIDAFKRAIKLKKEAGSEQTVLAEATQTNLALTHLRRGRVNADLDDLAFAKGIYEEQAKTKKSERPYYWAIDQWNLADLALAQWEITKEVDRLETAQKHLDDARNVFEQGLSEFQLAKCDELQEQIDKARAK